jgi:hypothetical protein
MDAYFRDREQIPPSDLITLKMDDFTMDIMGNMRMIYEKFDLGDFSKVSERFARFLDQNPRPEHNSTPPTDETIRLVNQYASGIMHTLGY